MAEASVLLDSQNPRGAKCLLSKLPEMARGAQFCDVLSGTTSRMEAILVRRSNRKQDAETEF